MMPRRADERDDETPPSADAPAAESDELIYIYAEPPCRAMRHLSHESHAAALTSAITPFTPPPPRLFIRRRHATRRPAATPPIRESAAAAPPALMRR